MPALGHVSNSKLCNSLFRNPSVLLRFWNKSAIFAIWMAVGGLKSSNCGSLNWNIAISLFFIIREAMDTETFCVSRIAHFGGASGEITCSECEETRAIFRVAPSQSLIRDSPGGVMGSFKIGYLQSLKKSAARTVRILQFK